MVELSVLKGTKDRFPDEQILRERIITILKEAFKLYGFQPATTPILEPFEILASKYAGGAEILKETYKLTDQGGRSLGLRYDLSVPLSRLVGMNPNIGRPFKRYEIGPCFRDGPIKKGRYREFIQCDADTVGVTSMLADAECLALSHHIFTELDLQVYMEVNNRKLLSGVLIAAGVPKNLVNTTILSIDKMKKIGIDGVRSELDSKGVEEALTDEIFTYFEYEGPFLEILDKLEPRIDNSIGKEGVKELRELYHYLELYGIQNDVKLLYSLARGLEIYTGTVFEAFLKDSEKLDSSLCGGGRYDEIIAAFLGIDEKIPAVGISFGLDTIFDALSAQGAQINTSTQVYIIPIKTIDEAIELAGVLRKNRYYTEVDLLDRRLSKNLEYANRRNIPYVIIMGKRDLINDNVTLKSMVDGKEEKISIQRIVSRLHELVNP
ncbi:MAG: histidine--tRNA ligase [Candidatus Hodarchaeales archaeon]|jgi:histidyl-tRNA synthetase